MNKDIITKSMFSTVGMIGGWCLALYFPWGAVQQYGVNEIMLPMMIVIFLMEFFALSMIGMSEWKVMMNKEATK